MGAGTVNWTVLFAGWAIFAAFGAYAGVGYAAIHFIGLWAAFVWLLVVVVFVITPLFAWVCR